MASRDPDYKPEGEEGMAPMVEESDTIEVEEQTGPIRRREADDFSQSLDQIMDRFCKLLREDKHDALQTMVQTLQNDALQTMVQTLQNLMASVFREMHTADVNMVMACMKDPSCTYLRRTHQGDTIQSINPEEEVTSGEEVLKHLPALKRYTSAVQEHIVSCFDHLTAMVLEASSAAATISTLRKIIDEETLDIMLRVAVTS